MHSSPLHAAAAALRATAWVLAAALCSAPALAADKPTILVFTSDSSKRTEALVAQFKRDSDYAIRMSYNVSDMDDPTEFLRENLDEVEPSLVLAVGAAALSVAGRYYSDVPLLFANASMQSAANLGRGNLVGVAQRVDPVATVAKLKQLMPRMRVLSALRRAGDTDEYWEALDQACSEASVDLVIYDVSVGQDLRDVQLRAMAGSDLLMIVHDLDLWDSGGLAEVFRRAADAEFPVLTYSARHLSAKVPPTLAVRADAERIAAEAARISREILVDGKDIDDFESGYPQPVLVGHPDALIAAHVPLGKKRRAEIELWTDNEERP